MTHALSPNSTPKGIQNETAGKINAESDKSKFVTFHSDQPKP